MERLESRRLYAAGDLDTTFGDDGIVQDEIPSLTSVTDAIVLDDGKILVSGGTVDILIAERRQYMLRRYTADGELDPAFGSGGVLFANFTSQEDEDSRITDIALQSDGKIVALGEASGVGLGFAEVLARFNADGTLDVSFGDEGIVPLPFGGGEFLDVRSDDRIVLASDSHVRRFLADGTLDTDFGDDGQADTAVHDLRTMKLQPDGKILLGGDINGFMIQRLNADGSVDTAFGENGLIDEDELPGTDVTLLNQLELLPGGQILATGMASTVATGETDIYRVVRYNADGSVDQTYGGGDGAATVPMGAFLFPADVVIDDDGRAVLIGDNPGISTTRVTADGEFDETFGRVVLNYRQDPLFGVAGGVQPNGNIIVVAQHNTRDAEGDYHTFVNLQRLKSDDSGPMSPVSLDDGVVSVPGTGAPDIIELSETGDLVVATLNGVGRAFEVADVDAVSATAGGGNDYIDARFQTIGAHIAGGAGSDKIAGGEGPDTIEGNGGRDFIDAGAGKDLISGGAGSDVIRGQAGSDRIYGRAGNDYIEGNGGNDRIDGGAGQDNLHGNAGNDFFLAADGAIDQLFGDGGNDSANADEDDLLISIETT